MRRHPVPALLLALALACAGAPVAEPAGEGAGEGAGAATVSAPTPAPRQEGVAPAAATPGSTPGTSSDARRRLEEFARRSAGGDAEGMEAAFEAEAAEEMARRRAEALERGRASLADAPDLDTALLTDDILSGVARAQREQAKREPDRGRPEVHCLPEDPGEDPDLFRGGELARGDFQAASGPAPGPVASGAAASGPAASGPEGQAAWLQVGIGCVLALDVQGDAGAPPTIQVSGVQWYAFARRSASWWGEGSEADEAGVLAHQQLHLALARLLATELGTRLPAIIEATRTTGPHLDSAADAFHERWLAQLDGIAEELRELIADYDRETLHGADAAAQQAWAARVRGGLGDVRGLAPL